MAECVTLGSHNMKEFPSNLDLPVEISGEDLNLCHEGQEHHDPNYTEERFRVDRRKLEQMIRSSGNGHSETAEDFFLKIMEETNTQITWPSKLKIGAKSKKDPHIKVAGKRYDVADAKEKVMAVLDTKSTRVTLKMDVSHTEHSHVIGKAGNNIKRVMEETGCHIHFPDSNRNNQAEKSNQVSIAGQPFGVEQARVKIRELLPLVFMFELPVTGLLQSIPDASSPIVQQIQQSYDVSVTFKQRPRSYATTVIIRGSVNNANSIKQATAVLIEHLTGTIAINSLASVTVSMQLEIAPQHHLFIIGRGGANIKQIMQRTGATIHFPDPNNVQPQRKGTVYVTGSMDSVFLARQQLIGYLPLVLMFDMKEDTDIDQGHISLLMEQLDVFISVKPKQKQPSKSVIVKSVERNAANLYEARRRLLGSYQNASCIMRSFASTPDMSTGPSSVVDPNEASFNLANLAGLLGQSLLNINTNPPMMMNGARSPLSGPQSPCSTAPPPLISTQHVTGLCNPLMVLGPSAAFNLQGVHQQYNMYTQPNGINKEFAQENIFLKQHTTQPERVTVSVASLQSSSESAQSSPTSSTSPLDLLSSSPATPNPITNPLSSAIAYSAMAAAANQDTELTGVHHVRPSNSLMDMLPKKGSPCNSTADLFSCRLSLTPPSANPNSSLLTGSPGPPPESPIMQQEGMSLNDRICSIAFQNSDHRASDSNCDADNCSDNLAPGHNRPLMSPSCLYSNNSFFAAFDYEQKKQLATKAMQKKPDGESRTPTDVWAGLGFSKSMPDSAIREKLKLHNVRYNGPSMTTTYEALNGEVDRDPWKDSNSVEGGPDTITSGDYMSLVSNNHMDNSTVSRSSDWPPKTELAELFSKLGLDKYNDLFQQEEIDLATFLTMTDQDLKDLGISTFGARRKMLLAIGDLYKRNTAMSTGHQGAMSTGHQGASNPFRDSSASSGIIGSRRHDIASHSGRW